jgi:hypothetical protein
MIVISSGKLGAWFQWERSDCGDQSLYVWIGRRKFNFSRFCDCQFQSRAIWQPQWHGGTQHAVFDHGSDSIAHKIASSQRAFYTDLPNGSSLLALELDAYFQ